MGTPHISEAHSINTGRIAMGFLRSQYVYPVKCLLLGVALIAMVHPLQGTDTKKTSAPAKTTKAPAPAPRQAAPAPRQSAPAQRQAAPAQRQANPKQQVAPQPRNAAPNTSAPSTNGQRPGATTSGPTTGAPGRNSATPNNRTGFATPGSNVAHGTGRVANGHTVVQAGNGATLTRRPDGKIASLRDPKRGVEVHRGLNGTRQVAVERPDHSRVFVEHGRHGYIQKPYIYHGHEYATRSYYHHGAYYQHYYGRYSYRGAFINPYYPAYYYGPAYYGWVYNPWAFPVAYAWGWAGDPWYGYYGPYFTPYPVYASPALWLTDFVISSTLNSAFQARAEAQYQQADELSNPAPLTPEVKQLISEEVRRQVALENFEAQASTRNVEPDAASSSIQRPLSDGLQHVYVAGQDLDVVDSTGAECALSQGDAVQFDGRNSANTTSVNVIVLASKGGRECRRGTMVAVSLEDLQEMQNHMRETIDQGMQELQKKQGQGGLPAAPLTAKAAPVPSIMATIAPPPPPENEVAAQLAEQATNADAAERDAAATPNSISSASPAPTGTATAGNPPTITMGQTPDEVSAVMGQPKSIMDLGSKKIYIYRNMKVTFNGNKVTDIE